jgi:oxaloacetate decarboxylase alpha subunit
VRVNGQSFEVEVAPSGAIGSITPAQAAAPVPATNGGKAVLAPLAGNVFKLKVADGQAVKQGDVVLIMEAMKMETEVRAARDGTVVRVAVREGDAVALKAPLFYLD